MHKADQNDHNRTEDRDRRHSVVDRRSGLDRRDVETGPDGSPDQSAAAGSAFDTNLDVEVAGWTAANAGQPLARYAQRLAVVDAGGERHLHDAVHFDLAGNRAAHFANLFSFRRASH